MLKDAGELIKGVVAFFGNPKIVVAIFLGSAAWLYPPVRQLLPVHGQIAEYASLTASVTLILSGAFIVVSGSIWLFQQANRWKRSPERILSAALRHATPLEKGVLEAVIHKGQYKLDLDVGSPIAMHLQEIGLIKKATGLPYTMYQLARGLADLCIRKPALLRVTDEEEKAVVAELEQWRRKGIHQRFFHQISGPTSTSWMA